MEQTIQTVDLAAASKPVMKLDQAKAHIRFRSQEEDRIVEQVARNLIRTGEYEARKLGQRINTRCDALRLPARLRLVEAKA